MKTIEEVKEWLILAAEKYGRDWTTRPEFSFHRGLSIGKESLAMQCVEFINSEPPCSHVQGIGMLVTSVGVGMSPFRAYLGHKWKADEMEFYKFKFCPECGRKLQ